MRNSTRLIGKKIRERRTQLGLTQKELCGDTVTRNMISRIESGDALPSLGTLLSICDKLGVTPDSLLSDEADPEKEAVAAVLPEIERFYRDKDYASALYCYDKYRCTADGALAFMMADACCRLAYAAVVAGNFKTAAGLIARSREFAERTFFPTAAVSAKLEILNAISANVQSPKLELDRAAYESLCREAVAEEEFRYLTEDRGYAYSNEKYVMHLEAKALMKQNDYRRALDILNALEDHRTDGGLSALFLFRLYSDLEICHRELRNFENAYRYSTKRLSLLTSFES